MSTTHPPSSVLKKIFLSKGQINTDPLMYNQCGRCRVIVLLIQTYRTSTRYLSDVQKHEWTSAW
jgi:hypothetical protein